QALDTASADLELFTDGVSQGTTSASGNVDRTNFDTALRIGNSGSLIRDFDGELDEIRVASTTRSAAWIEAEYTNQNTPTTFYSVSGASSGGGGDGITITGTLYQNDGVTALGAGHTVVAAVGTSTASRHSTTTAADGSFSITDIATSTIGAWATTSGTGDVDYYSGVTYGNGLFVIVGTGGSNLVATSPDGLTWTGHSAAGDNDVWYDVVYGEGLFVAVGDGSDDILMTSPDGVNWTPRSAAGDNDDWYGVTYGNGRFVAVGNGFVDRIMYSEDGITWSTTTAPGGNNDWGDVTFGNGRFVAVGGGQGASTGDYVMYSDDGINWATTSAAGDNDNWSAVTYGNGRFVAVGRVGGDDRVMYSDDGINWTATSAAEDDDTWRGVAYANGQFVAVASAGDDLLMTSQDGITWSTESVAGTGWWGVAYGAGRFVVIDGDTIDAILYADAGFGEDTPITLFVDAPSATTSATTLTYGVNGESGGTITADLVADTVTLDKQTIGSSSNEIYVSDADFYDSEDDADILFTATTSTATINADLSIASGTNVFGSQNLVVEGDLSNAGTFNGESGAITLQGDFSNNATISVDDTTITIASYIQEYLTGEALSGSPDIYEMLVVGNTLYIGTEDSAGTCNTSTGADCELLVFDISSSTDPVFVTAREVGIGSAGAQVFTLASDGVALYVGRTAYSGTCNTATGEFCELWVYDISSTTNPVFANGREAGDGSSGSRIDTVYSIDTTLYVGRWSYSGTCNASTGVGCEILIYDISSSTNPTYVGGSETGTGSDGSETYAFHTVGDTLFVGRSGYSGACTTSTGDG
ncbi:MAG TPA: sialidase family protein, partial [Candidatus Paceibacterota bacterium]|nr:sialidase family protein [Candidatus Paceibacterota bacterium]